MTEGCGPESASQSVRDLLQFFDCLAERDRRQFVVEILRRLRELEWPLLDEETINQIADDSFLEYDRREVDWRVQFESESGPGSA